MRGKDASRSFKVRDHERQGPPAKCTGYREGTGRVPGGYPGGYPGGSPQFAFSRKTPHTAPPKNLASSSARPAAALRDIQDSAGLRPELPQAVKGEHVQDERLELRVPSCAGVRTSLIGVIHFISIHVFIPFSVFLYCSSCFSSLREFFHFHSFPLLRSFCFSSLTKQKRQKIANFVPT